MSDKIKSIKKPKSRKVIQKYKNQRCSFNNIKFQSRLERDFYIWANNHANSFGYEFKFQVPYKISDKRKYIADFVFTKDNKDIVVDVKSPATITEIFKLKRDIMFIKHGIKVEIVFTINDLIKLLK